MTSSPPGDEVTLDDVVARVRELPRRLRSLYVETERRSDERWKGMASSRAHGTLVHGPDPSTQPERRSTMRSRSWMEFGDDAWRHAIVGVQPTRWRNEARFAWADGTVEDVVSGQDGEVAWSGDDVDAEVTTAGRGSLRDWWVVNRQWVEAPVGRELLEVGRDVLGRGCARVRLVPEPGRQRFWAPGPFCFAGDQLLDVDLTTGMTLAVTSSIEGVEYEHHEVVALELDSEIDAELTVPPSGARPRPPKRTYRDAVELAADVPEFALVAPKRVPPGYDFRLGDSLVERDGSRRVLLMYWQEERRALRIHESAASPREREDVDGWTWVERGDRAVLVSDVTDAPGERLASLSVGGTDVFIHAALSADELLDVAFSLEPVRP